jgi:hypothetical protein
MLLTHLWSAGLPVVSIVGGVGRVPEFVLDRNLRVLLRGGIGGKRGMSVGVSKGEGECVSVQRRREQGAEGWETDKG